VGGKEEPIFVYFATLILTGYRWSLHDGRQIRDMKFLSCGSDRLIHCSDVGTAVINGGLEAVSTPSAECIKSGVFLMLGDSLYGI
jgi:hypothetical protein